MYKRSVRKDTVGSGLHDKKEIAVEFENFTFMYYNSAAPVLNRVNFRIGAGEKVLLAGVSGSGKSTLCYAVAGLIPWSIGGYFGGTVRIFGESTEHLPPNRLAGRVCLMLQNAECQFVNLTVREELVFGAANLRFDRETILTELERICSLLDIGDLRERHVLQLSGGEKQKVILGSLLMMRPRILVLDEPLSYLDLPSRISFLQTLDKITGELGELTVIIAEHRTEAVLPFVDRVLYLENGNIREYKPDGFLRHQYKGEKYHVPPSLYTGDLISKIKIPESGSLPSGRATGENRAVSLRGPEYVYHDLLRRLGFILQQNEDMREDSGNSPDGHPVISVRNIVFGYNGYIGKYGRKYKRVIDGISFDIFRGEKIAVVGPNGSGKSTLLYLLAGFLEPEYGDIYIWGGKPEDPRIRKKIGFIFQNPETQILSTDIRSEIMLGPKYLLGKDTIDKNTMELYLDLIFGEMEYSGGSVYRFCKYNIVSPENPSVLSENVSTDGTNSPTDRSIKTEDRASRNPFLLSWGQKRRLNIISLYAYGPEIYLMDEPFIGQDYRTRSEINAFLTDITGNKATYVIGTHDPDIIFSCDRVFLLENGKLTVFVKENKKE